MRRDPTLGFRVSEEFVADHPDVDASAVELAINVMAVAELAATRMEALTAPFGLTKGGCNLLVVLAGAESPITPTEIGKRLVARPATITGLVDTLVRRGYAERAADPRDRRRVLVSITPTGRTVAADASAVIMQSDQKLMAPFTEAERERFIRLLGRLQYQLKNHT